jgi:putative glutamine amidotransferase
LVLGMLIYDAQAIQVDAMMKAVKAPWIGLPAQLDPNSDRCYLGQNYSEAVVAAGGTPLIMPVLAAAGSVSPLVERLDGIVLTGNKSDLDPALYATPRSDQCGPAQPLRDQMDFFLLRAAFRRKIPILAICFGIQSLNVFLGGTLVQDIAAVVGNSIQHNSPPAGAVSNHEIRLCPGMALEQLAGRRPILVNSTHHQAVDRLGSGLQLEAKSPDGVIEAVSGTNPDHWILGVQWHPEKDFTCDDFSRKIFDLFLARCRAVGRCDEGTHS